jgi:hypothetical protein
MNEKQGDHLYTSAQFSPALMVDRSGLYQASYIKPAFSRSPNPQMLHMLQTKGKQVSGHATRGTTFRPEERAQT